MRTIETKIYTVRIPISKTAIKLAMYKPAHDYYFEKVSRYAYKLHLSPHDAANSILSLSSRFNVSRIPDTCSQTVYMIEETRTELRAY